MYENDMEENNVTVKELKESGEKEMDWRNLRDIYALANNSSPSS